jgi:hypothetical protein
LGKDYPFILTFKGALPMVTKKEPKKNVEEIEGELIFKEVTPSKVKFDFDSNDKILSNRNFDVSRDLLPADFEHADHKVRATYLIVIETMEK